MNISILTPLSEATEELYRQKATRPHPLEKCRKQLKDYATSLGKNLSELRMIDVCSENDFSQLNPRVTKFIQSFYKTKKPRYRYEAKCRIGKIILALFPTDTNNKKTNQDPLPEIRSVPDFMRDLLPALPRQNIYSISNASRQFKYGEDNTHRLSLPLSRPSHKLLTILLEVAEEHKVTDLSTLFLKFRTQIWEKILELKTHREISDVISCFYLVRQRLRLNKNEPKKTEALDLKDFPPRLRKQCETFLELAPVGLEHDGRLKSKAEPLGISLAPITPKTIDGYLDLIGRVLKKFNFEDYENLEIQSFLKTSVKTIVDEEGEEHPFLYNPLVEKYREFEKERPTYAKRIGFDSATFMRFCAAIKAIAAFNKIFSYHARFNRAYELSKDRDSIRVRKKLKKRMFDRPWVDSEIKRLHKRFVEIVKTKAFMNNGRRSKTDATYNLRLCLFYVMLVTLRYGGHRQQCVRNCEIGKNVVFKPDSSVIFHWEEYETKNKVELTSILDPKIYQETIGLYIEALNIYYREVYSYVCKNSAGDLENQLYCYLNKYGECQRFKPSSAREFSGAFSRWCVIYLNLERRRVPNSQSINPHFFRGLCVDWLYYDLGVSIKNVAAYIGDTEETVRREYLDKNQPQRANNALDEANYNIKIRHHNEALAEKDAKDALVRMLEDSRNNEKILEAKIAELETEKRLWAGA